MKFNCKVWPVQKPHPAFPRETFHWAPLLNVRLVYQHAQPSNWIETFVDSGSPDCMFHASVSRHLGIRRLEDGIETQLGGVIGGQKVPIYFHPVKILVGSEQIQTMVGFSWGLSVGGLLGRRGFFENFVVKIDSSTTPPSIELERIHRA